MKAIGTWKMSYEAFKINSYQKRIDDFLINSIKYVEDMKDVHTVGSYSVPNDSGFLELDAAFMNGDSLMFGSVVGIRNERHPIEVAYKLSKLVHNNILCSNGANRYALENDLGNNYPDVYKEETDNSHDTCGMCALNGGSIKAAISSSGRANKHEGRVGDSPLIGSGFYADSEFCAVTSTGDGEAIARAVLAKSITDEYKICHDLQMAMNHVVDEYLRRIEDYYVSVPSFCCVGIDADGNFAACTSLDDFPFATYDDGDVKLMVCRRVDGKVTISEADEEFLKNYKGD